MAVDLSLITLEQLSGGGQQDRTPVLYSMHYDSTTIPWITVTADVVTFMQHYGVNPGDVILWTTAKTTTGDPPAGGISFVLDPVEAGSAYVFRTLELTKSTPGTVTFNPDLISQRFYLGKSRRQNPIDVAPKVFGMLGSMNFQTLIGGSTVANTFYQWLDANDFVEPARDWILLNVRGSDTDPANRSQLIHFFPNFTGGLITLNSVTQAQPAANPPNLNDLNDHILSVNQLVSGHNTPFVYLMGLSSVITSVAPAIISAATLRAIEDRWNINMESGAMCIFTIYNTSSVVINGGIFEVYVPTTGDAKILPSIFT